MEDPDKTPDAQRAFGFSGCFRMEIWKGALAIGTTLQTFQLPKTGLASDTLAGIIDKTGRFSMKQLQGRIHARSRQECRTAGAAHHLR